MCEMVRRSGNFGKTITTTSSYTIAFDVDECIIPSMPLEIHFIL
jgi:hypothetical protein